jgi:hypothetical protein
MLSLGRWLALAILLLSPSAFAATQNPELKAHMGENQDGSLKSRDLAIRHLDIAIEVHGGVAATTLTASFINSGSQPLEGDFAFDLPAGAVVTGYALDVNGQMVDGVLAAARQAKKVYERAVRRGVDPGLAEVTRANAFTNRVFPILPQRGRTIRLEFATPLDPEAPLVVPLSTDQPVGTFSIRVRADGLTEAPHLTGPGDLVLKWTRTANGWEASGSFSKRPLSGALTLGPVTAAKKLLVSRHMRGDMFFEINDALPASARMQDRSHVRIYWDSSRSRRDQDLAGEITLATRYVAAVHAKTVDLVFFADGEPVVKTGTGKDVESALRAADYRGATSITSLFKARLPQADACLLFTDGNFTIDSWSASALPCQTSVVSAARDANRGLLRRLARISGGSFADLGAQNTNTALARLLRQNSILADVSDSAGHKLEVAVFPANGLHLHLAGPLPARGDILVKIPGEAAARRYAIDRTSPTGDDAAAQLWAAQHIDAMNATDQPDRDQMLATARRYAVASPIASFVVYETVEDYVQAEVEPPTSLGKGVVSDYRQRLTQERQAKDAAQKERLNTIVGMWTEEKAWWERKFDPRPAPPPVPPPSRPAPPYQDNAPQGEIMLNVQPNAAPPPAMMVAPAAPRSSGALPEFETVTVSGARAVPQPDATPSIAVTIAPWNSKRPYIAAMGDPAAKSFWSNYREQDAKNGASPAFYIDVSEVLFRAGKSKEAISVLLNALDLPSADVSTYTIVAGRLMRYGDLPRAIWLYERIAYLEPDRPQPYRNLALALIARAEATPQNARADYARALKLLSKVVMQPWEGEFNGIEVISLMEANRVIPKLRALGDSKFDLDPRLIALLDVDLRVVLEWNTDETDMDLWVDEPTGERCIFSHRNTNAGGRLSNDMRFGYGPEEYLLHRAPNGNYVVRVNVFATDRINPNGATAVRATVFQNYGRPNEQKQTLELELGRDDKDASLVGTVAVNH